MNNEQLARYSKNIFLPLIDLDGQEALLASSVLVVGLGGIGSICAQYLASSGVGELYLCDDDLIDATNLQRQILYQENDLSKKKSHTMQSIIKGINPEIKTHYLPHYQDSKQHCGVLKNVDIVIDCSDNFQTRFLINQHVVQYKKPHIMSACIGFKAQISLLKSPQTACYACLYNPKHALSNPFSENCSDSGVFAPIAGIAGCLASAHALKFLCGVPSNLMGYLFSLNVQTHKTKSAHITRDPLCSTCNKIL